MGVAAIALAACSPMVVDHGVPNFVQVGPGVYRSGQITTAEGWQHVLDVAKVDAAHLHVIKLNYAAEGRDLPPFGVDLWSLAIPPEDGDVLSVLAEPSSESLALVESLLEHAKPGDAWLIHCSHGQDRTGLVIGRYRVQHDHWSRHQAFAEMLANHFHPELIGLLLAWEALR